MNYLRENFLLLMSLFIVISVSAQDDFDYNEISGKYRQKEGNLWFKNIGLAYSGMTNNSVMTDTIYYFNYWSEPMTIGFERIPDFITCKPIPEVIPPKSEGKLAVTYDAVKKGEFGRIVDYFFIKTNDPVKPRKRILISPTIKEDFSYLTEEDKSNPPIVSVPETSYDFGTINQGDTVMHRYPIVNKGSRDLIIRSARASCGCTKAYPENDTIPVDGTGYIKVVYKSRGKKGEQKYRVNVITNDPHTPSVKMEISGYVLTEEEKSR